MNKKYIKAIAVVVLLAMSGLIVKERYKKWNNEKILKYRKKNQSSS